MRALLLAAACVAIVGCTFGANTCTSNAECSGGATCDPSGFCVGSTDSGSGGGTTTGGGGGGATGGGGGGSTGGGTGGTGGGGAVTRCDAGLSCAEWQECLDSVSGAACEDSDLLLAWTQPNAGTRTNAMTISGQLTVAKRDGGVARVSTVPVRSVDGTAVVSGTQSPFAVNINLGLADGTQTYVAGWEDGGPVESLNINVDRTGPVFVIGAIADAGYGTATADFLPVDPNAPAAYRKDDVLDVRVTSIALDVSTTKLVAQFGTQPRYEVLSSTSCGGGCADFRVDLSRVAMPSFSGTVRLTVEGTDTLGNPGTVMAPRDLAVTRWQWARRVTSTGSLRSAPALGTGGRIFLGAWNSVSTGAVVALHPDGGTAWGPISDGPVEGPVAVGRGTTGEWLFYAVNSGASKNVDAANGASVQAPTPGSSGATNAGGVVLLGENTAGVGSVSLEAATTRNRARQNEPQSGRSNPSIGQDLAGVAAPGNMVIGAGSAYFVNSDGNLKRLAVSSGVDPVVGTLDQPVGVVGTMNGLALTSGTRVVGGGGPGIGKLIAFDVTAGTTDSALNAWAAPTALSSPTSGPSVGSGGLFAQYKVTGRSNLLRVNPSTGVVVAQSAALGGAGPVQSSFGLNSAPTPTLGDGNKVYVVDEKGSLFVVPQDFAGGSDATWSVALPSGVLMGAPVVVTASPNLDCNRRMPQSETGVLYIATETGWLVSYLVDSKGLDPTATWPKYARDARNTGNFGGPAIGCP